jgi:hypothetical protein
MVPIIAMSAALLGCGEQEFNLCTYNIKGLPANFSDYNPAESVPKISEIINKLNQGEKPIDILVVQENFVPEYKFLMSTDYPSRYPIPELCQDAGYEEDWKNCHALLEQEENHLTVKTGSGLSAFTTLPTQNPHGLAWGDKCYGLSDGGRDCAAPKGIGKIDIQIAPKAWAVLLYLHAQSGDRKEEQEIRNIQFEMTRDYINQLAENKAVILTGDFNEYKPQSLQIFKEMGFIDLCNLYSCSEQEIDRIMIRDGIYVKIEPQKLYTLDHFVNDEGENLSDHSIVCADFRGYSSFPGNEGFNQR